MPPVKVVYYSDVLCIWAYAAQARLEALRRQFGDRVAVENRFCSIFGDTAAKIGGGWADRGGYAGFNRHVRQVAQRFPHIDVHPDLWLSARPVSSAGVHLLLKAVELAHDGAGPAEAAAWSLRQAFFRDGRDIADWRVQCEIVETLGADRGRVEAAIHSGAAFARLAADFDDSARLRVEGSPTFILNEGRQRLYGNVGYRVLEANVEELLRVPAADQASWC